jgi:hypothetical protein
MKSECSLGKRLSDQKVLNVSFDGLSGELEARVLGVCKDIIQQTSKGDDQLTYKTTDDKDTVSLSFWVTDIVDLSCCRVEVFLGS